jgi:hypothetical protein
VQGDGWVITERELGELLDFVATTHELDFEQEVIVSVVADIGADIQGYEPFSVEEWNVLRSLGLVDPAAGESARAAANQVRFDRIRGVCCRGDVVTEVSVEVQPTKLATETILVHELTHALHRQHPDLDRVELDFSEFPLPAAAGIEGVPQYVAFAYLAVAPSEEQAAVLPDLPIIRDDMLPSIGIGAAQYLNFAYATGPAFVEAIVAERGVPGLSDVLTTPPTTTEQVLFPEKYLTGEGASSVPAPEIPEGVTIVRQGRYGAAMLSFVLTEAVDEGDALDLVEPWAGDRFVHYVVDEVLCTSAVIEMDSADAAVAIAGALRQSLSADFADPSLDRQGELVLVRTC